MATRRGHQGARLTVPVRRVDQLETKRLRLRHWREDDFNSYAAYYANEETARFVGGCHDRDKAWRRMASELGHWILRGYGYWAVEEKETAAFVGCVGLWLPEGWPELELGYWLMPEMQGKGYAAEACLRSLDYAYEVVGVDTLVSYIDPENEPSKRLAERLGGRYENIIELLDFGPHCVYRYRRPRG